VIGGRNIGAEYFAARTDMNFGDLDLLAFGPVGHDAGRAFDDYWNSEAAVPISVLAPPPEDAAADLARVRSGLDESFATIDGTEYDAALDSKIMERVDLHPDMLYWAPALLVYDAPEKSRTGTEADDAVADDLRVPLRQAIEEATEELLVVSPYFVPLDSGVEFLCALLKRGVRTAIVTNSLTSTDVAAVHAGYAPYREDLLECGVELYETREDSRIFESKRGRLGLSQSSLHAKGFVIDRRRLFIGSFNWDPRSVGINTEMGILVDSAPLARDVADLIESRFAHAAYHLVLDDGDIRWITYEGDEKVVLDKEPGTTFWQRFNAGFLELLPIRGQL
jgi:putative cardiolipin synthase